MNNVKDGAIAQVRTMAMAYTLGQNFRFGYDWIPPLTRMRAIRRAGFDDTMLWWGDEFASTDGFPMQLWRMARAQGLHVRTAHFPSTCAHHLWLEGEMGDRYERQLTGAIRDCGRLGIAHLVLHTTRRLITPPPCPQGAARLHRALRVAEVEGVDIALENTRFLRYNQYLYDQLDSPRLKFCFDSGHANCYTPQEDPLALFGDRLCTMHLHDNYGPAAGDQHHPLGQGTVDLDSLFARLAALQPESYNLESYAPPALAARSPQEYLSGSYRTLASRIRAAAHQQGV